MSSARLSRRGFVKACAVASVAGLVPAVKGSFADDAPLVRFTESVAQAKAQSFLDSVVPDEELFPGEVTKVHSQDGEPFGFVVDFITSSGSHNGYVVFDASRNGAVYEFSVAEGALNPCAQGVVSAYGEAAVVSDEDDYCFLSDVFSYAVYSCANEAVVDMYGEDITSQVDATCLAAVPDSNWDDIFVSLESGYSITSSNYAPAQFIAFSESEVKQNTGRYACAVSALLNCAPHYLGDMNFPWVSWASDYIELWNKTSTSVAYTSGGITLGSTSNGNLGPGFVSYCADRGVSVSYSNSVSPSFQSYRSTIDRGDMGIFCCGINQSGSRVGHAMAVEGYAIMKYGSISDDIPVLVVADGWGWGARYLTIYYANFTDTYGIFFS